MLLCSQGIAQEAVDLTSQKGRTRTDVTPSERYAEHSVLQNGKWAKIRIAESGIYQLSGTLIKKCGFSDISKVKVYGYGGALQPESLTGDYLQATDDLKEVPTCTVGDRKLFYAVGTVSWESATALDRIRNNYSSYGYYFLTMSLRHSVKRTSSKPITHSPKTITPSMRSTTMHGSMGAANSSTRPSMPLAPRKTILCRQVVHPAPSPWQ